MLVCINLLTISGSTYPKVIIDKGDTLVIITKQQLLQTNRIFSEHNVYKQRVVLYQELSNIKDSIINVKDREVTNLSNVIKLQEDKFNIEKKYSDKLYKDLNKSNKIKKISLYAIPIAFVIGVLCQ